MFLMMKNSIWMQIPLKSISQSSLKTKAMITLSLPLGMTPVYEED